MDILQARAHQITELQTRAHALGVLLRSPPAQPTTCCGRGCNGCVWEGYYFAVDNWLEDAKLLLN